MNEAIRSFSVEGNSTAQLFLLSATPLKKLAKPWTMPAGCIWSKGAARPCVQTDSMHISPGRLLCAALISHGLIHQHLRLSPGSCLVWSLIDLIITDRSRAGRSKVQCSGRRGCAVGYAGLACTCGALRIITRGLLCIYSRPSPVFLSPSYSYSLLLSYSS
jgi:hypothetical protein